MKERRFMQVQRATVITSVRKNRGGGTHRSAKRRKNFRARHNCDECKGRITTPKCLACKKLW